MNRLVKHSTTQTLRCLFRSSQKLHSVIGGHAQGLHSQIPSRFHLIVRASHIYRVVTQLARPPATYWLWRVDTSMSDAGDASGGLGADTHTVPTNLHPEWSHRRGTDRHCRGVGGVCRLTHTLLRCCRSKLSGGERENHSSGGASNLTSLTAATTTNAVQRPLQRTAVHSCAQTPGQTSCRQSLAEAHTYLQFLDTMTAGIDHNLYTNVTHCTRHLFCITNSVFAIAPLIFSHMRACAEPMSGSCGSCTLIHMEAWSSMA